MALEGPQLCYARVDDAHSEDTLKKALDLARRIEELLEETRSVSGESHAAPVEHSTHARTHSTRMARAMAAGLVDELDALVRPFRKTGSS
ncbi:MAG: hypothetical protein JWP87_3012 [Labilithrix sp.]|nr:hypothetical protein [Labilithrix sp.]